MYEEVRNRVAGGRGCGRNGRRCNRFT